MAVSRSMGPGRVGRSDEGGLTVTSRTLTRGAAAAAALLGLTLAGCGANPGAAAVVNGQRITENELAAASADFAAVTGEPVEPAQMLGTLVVVPLILDVAQGLGVAATDDEAADLLDQQAEAVGVTPPEEPYSEGVLDIARLAIVNQTLAASPAGMEAQAEIGAAIAEADVEVSPRYGEYDPSGAVVPTAFPWIVEPAGAGLEGLEDLLPEG